MHKSLKSKKSADWKACPVNLDTPIYKAAQDHQPSSCNSLIWLSVITIQRCVEGEEVLQTEKGRFSS